MGCLLSLALVAVPAGPARAQSSGEPLTDPVPANLYTQLPDDELAWWPDGAQVEVYAVEVNDPAYHGTDSDGKRYIDLDQAESVCGSTGGTVATPDQLEQAYQQGAQWCYCGILSDGTFAYPMQTGSSGCARSKGVISCGSEYTRNLATCYGVRPSTGMVTAWDAQDDLLYFAPGRWSRYCDAEGGTDCPPAVQSVAENATVSHATVDRLSFAAPVPQPLEKNPMPPTALARGRFVTNDADQLVAMTKTGSYETTGQCYSYDYGLAGYVDPSALDPGTAPVSFPTWSERPCLAARTDWWSSPFDLAAGDLDRAMDSDGELHDELVIAVEAGDHGIDPPGYPVIHVLDYAGNPTDPVETVYELPHDDAHARNRLKYFEDENGAEPRGTLVAETFDAGGDGARLIATLHSTYDGSPNHDVFVVNVLEYTPPSGSAGSGKITPVGSFMLDSYSDSGSYRYTADLAAGDFDGDGKEELAVFYVVDDKSHLVVLAATPGQGVQTLSEWTNDTLSARTIERMELVSGLFYFDPDSGFDMGRRQLALGFYDRNAQVVRMKVFRLDGACRVALERDIYQAPATTTPTFGFAAGNFAGSQAQPTDPIWSLALGYGYGEDQDEYHVQLIDPWANQQTDIVRQAWDTEIPPVLLAFDRDGDSLYLGAPVTFQVDKPRQLLSSLEQPPQHLDYLPNQTGANSAGLFNVSRDRDFKLTFSETASSTLRSDQSSAFSWTAGGSVHASASATLSEKIPVIEKASLKGTAAAGVDYVHSNSSTSSAGNASQVTVQMSESPVADDALYLIMKPYEIWRYRLYGAETTDPNTPYAYYEVFKPTDEERAGWFPGLSVDAYQPLHENGNILSYPDIDTKNPDPPDLGSWSPTAQPPDCDQPPQPDVSYSRPLTGDDLHVLTFGGAQSTLKVELDKQDTCGGSRQTQDDLKESVDLRLSIQAKENEIFAKEQEKGSVNFHVSGSESWADLAAWNTTTQQSTNLAIQTVAWADPDFDYSFAPSLYFADDGNLKVAFYASPTGQTQNGWATTYSRPDPALNLPHKYIAPNGDDWQLNTSMDAGRIRGFALRDGAEIDPATGLGPLLASIPERGDTVQVEVMVYNYSVQQEFKDLEVRFDIADYDMKTHTASNRRILKDSVTATFTNERDPSGIGSNSSTFPPRGVGRALLELDTDTGSFKESSGLQSYLIYAVLNPSGTNPTSETHGWRSANVFVTLYTQGMENVGSTIELALTDQDGEVLGTVKATSTGNVPQDIENLAETFNESDVASTYGLQASAYPPQTPQNQPYKLVLTAAGNGAVPDPDEFQPTLGLKGAVNGVTAIHVAPSVTGTGNATIEASNLAPGQNNEGHGFFRLYGGDANASEAVPPLETSLVAADLSGRLVESGAQASAGRPLRLRLCAQADAPTRAIVDLPIFLGDPADGKGVAVKRLYGVDQDGSCAWFDWTPPAPGSYTLEVVEPQDPSAAQASGGTRLTVEAQ